MTDEKKVTEKEIQAAMNNFMKTAGMPPGMVNPIMQMMGNQNILPSQAVGMQQIASQQTQTMLPAGIYNPYTQQMGMAGVGPQNSSLKAIGMATKVRVGTPKVRNFGVCAECAKCTPENVAEDNAYLWCNAKGIRVKADSGIIYADKEKKTVDRQNSCRIFTKA